MGILNLESMPLVLMLLGVSFMVVGIILADYFRGK